MRLFPGEREIPRKALLVGFLLLMAAAALLLPTMDCNVCSPDWNKDHPDIPVCPRCKGAARVSAVKQVMLELQAGKHWCWRSWHWVPKGATCLC
jgi:hypothetical protein